MINPASTLLVARKPIRHSEKFLITLFAMVLTALFASSSVIGAEVVKSGISDRVVRLTSAQQNFEEEFQFGVGNKVSLFDLLNNYNSNPLSMGKSFSGSITRNNSNDLFFRSMLEIKYPELYAGSQSRIASNYSHLLTPALSGFFANSLVIAVPGLESEEVGNGTAGPYSSELTVSGLSGTITDLNVKINDFSHTFPQDVAMLLVSPGGQNFVLQSDVGGRADVENISYVFDDQASASIVKSGPFPENNASVRPSSEGNDEIFPTPAPAAPYAQPAPAASNTLNGVFGGSDPNGTWHLYVVDFFPGNSGEIGGGWELEIVTTGGFVTPAISAISPGSANENGTTFELAVNGSNFAADSIIRWNGQNLSTSYFSDTLLKAQVPSTSLQSPGSFPITIINPQSGNVSNVTNFSVVGCSYAIDVPPVTYTGEGGTGSASVTTSSGCQWSASSNDSWITVSGGNNVTGNGSITVSVAANTGIARTGSITVAGESITIEQSGGCSYSLSSQSSSIPATGSTGSTAITTESGCEWTATSNNSWITVSGGATSEGNGSVNFSVSANNGAERTGTITIAGNTFTINQTGGCSYTIGAAWADAPAEGASDTVSVTAEGGCQWTAVSNDGWVTVNSGAAGDGDGSVGYTVAANSGAARSGTITIAGESFTINQTGACTFTIDSNSISVGADHTTGTVNITTTFGCQWTAQSNASWVSLNSGSGGEGNGTVEYAVAANTGNSRSGTMTIAGKTFTITQSAPCSYSLDSTSMTTSVQGGTGSLNVVTEPGCAWAASSNESWLSITNGFSTSGNGQVNFSVMASAGVARTGTMTVAGETFSVYQIPGSVLSDYDGDGKSDISVFRPSDGRWHMFKSGAGYSSVPFGLATDKIAPADYDGDGKTDLAVWRESSTSGNASYFYILNSSDLTVTFEAFGIFGDSPVAAGDWDGDGAADVALYRKGVGDAQSYFIYRPSNQPETTAITIPWGIGTDQPAVADFDGDGELDAAVFRPSSGYWWIRRSTGGHYGIPFGIDGDRAVVGDYDGDGQADAAVYRPSNGTWYIQATTEGFWGAEFGNETDIPVPADYDGDGKTDLGIYRNGQWWLLNSANGLEVYSFGQETDRPASGFRLP